MILRRPRDDELECLIAGPSLAGCTAWNLAGRKTFPLQRGGSLMSNEPNGHRTAVVLFAVAVVIAILAALVTTLERIDTRTASNETPPGTTGLAKPHPPLDRAPGHAVLGN